MTRFGVILAATLFAGTMARGDELDSEFRGKSPASPAVAPEKSDLTASPESAVAGELDEESPAQSCFFGGRRFGYGFGYGGYRSVGFYGGRGYGYGYRPFGYGYGYRRIGYGYGHGFRRGFRW